MTQEEQAELNNELLAAASNGNNEEVKRLIAEGANVNAKDKEGLTPLHWAAGNNQTKIAQELIE